MTNHEIRCTMLFRSIYVLMSPIFMLFAVLACAGTGLLDTPSFTCPTAIPPTVLAGTPTPIPATPVVIVPPMDFYLGDPVSVGSVQFRLVDVMVHPDDLYAIYTWTLEVSNRGQEGYEVFPAYQMFISEVQSPYGEVSGVWSASQSAADEVGISADMDLYALAPNETRLFHLAASAPAGDPVEFSFDLTPTITDDERFITWANQSNPHCAP
ncbi:MAG: hypothetical protein RLP44_26920 [Aggregatilineales bacterium]